MDAAELRERASRVWSLPRLDGGDRVRAPVIAGLLVFALLALPVMLSDVLDRRR